jgi:hypothetical protein
MPSDPHHDTSTQPPDARLAVFMRSLQKKQKQKQKQKQICFADFHGYDSGLSQQTYKTVS